MRLVYSAYWAMASGGGVSYWVEGFRTNERVNHGFVS